jgi:molecular chaperone GrpE
MAPKDDSHQENENEHPWHEPVVHDKRRVDPVTGKVRNPEGEHPSGPAGEQGDEGRAAEAGARDASAAGASGQRAPGQTPEPADASLPQGGDDGTVTDADLDALLRGSEQGDGAREEAERVADERLADLQRITAEFANYRKRTDSNRALERERIVADVASALLPVLDDLDRAQKHGDLDDGTSAFATIAAKLRGVAERLGLTKFGAAGEPFDHNLHDALFQKPDPDVTVDTIDEVVETGYTLGTTLVRAAKVVVATPDETAQQ